MSDSFNFKESIAELRLIELEKRKMHIFSGTSNEPLAKDIAKELGINLSPVTIKRFSDAEIWCKYHVNLRGRDVFIVQSTTSSDAILELLIMIDAAKRAAAKRVIAVIPYFGYSRQDIKDGARVPLSSALICHIIEEAGIDGVILSELHNKTICGFFSSDVKVEHLYLTQKFWPLYKDIPNLVVSSTDAGSEKMARYYAKKLNSERAVAEKIRGGHNVVKEIKIIGDLKNRNVLFVDELIDTGGTQVKVVKKGFEMGALDMYFASPHALFTGNAFGRIQEIEELKGVVIANTINRDSRKLPKKIKEINVADVYAEASMRFHKDESISALYVEQEEHI